MRAHREARAFFRFYAQLNDFLSCERKGVTFVCAVPVGSRVKDLIEALGVPHPEVDLILVNGVPAAFSCPLLDGDRVSVYPRFQSIEIESLTQIRPRALREVRFITDTHLGRLASYLRMLGFDTLYRNDYCDEDLAELSRSQGRALLTKDLGLLKRSAITHGYFVREIHPPRQLREVVCHFDVSSAMAPFRRCLRCNGLLRPAVKQDVESQLPPRTKELFNEFHVCPACGRIYWKGSHYERMQRLINSVTADSCPRQKCQYHLICVPGQDGKSEPRKQCCQAGRQQQAFGSKTTFHSYVQGKWVGDRQDCVDSHRAHGPRLEGNPSFAPCHPEADVERDCQSQSLPQQQQGGETPFAACTCDEPGHRE